MAFVAAGGALNLTGLNRSGSGGSQFVGGGRSMRVLKCAACRISNMWFACQSDSYKSGLLLFHSDVCPGHESGVQHGLI